MLLTRSRLFSTSSAPQTAPPRQSLAGAVAAAALAVAASVAWRDASQTDLALLRPSGEPGAEELAALRSWLSARGCDVSLLEFAPSSEPSVGLSIALRSEPPDRRSGSFWFLRPRTNVFAAFPQSSALTAHSVTQEPQLGGLYAQWLRDELLSEREAVQLFLLVERARGAASPWHHYVACLPRPPLSTPLWWTQLNELAGTPLWEAVWTQRRQLEDRWRSLAPLAAEALRAAGAGSAARHLTLDDFQWATSVYWSRAMRFSDAEPSSEGIVPGLDFCNHASGAQQSASWALLGWQDGSGGTFVLAEAKHARLSPGAELRIDYGRGRSNEELLFLYGFAEERNPADALLVAPPLPRDQAEAASDASHRSRMALLSARGLEPRVFLPADGGAAQLEEAISVFSLFAQSPAELDADLAGALKSRAKADVRRRALMLLQRLLEQRRDAMAVTGSVAEDEARLRAGGLEPTRLAAIRYRLAQKRICAHYLGLVRARC